jgi:branched-chain amino acid transport system permease protein
MSIFYWSLAQFSAVYILLGWAVYLMFRVNQPYFGSLYSMCIGAYFAAYASINWHLPFWLVLIGAVAVCVAFSALPALRLAKLGPLPMVIASMGIVMVVQTAVRNIPALGANFGLFGMPPMSRPLLLGITYAFLVVVGFAIYRLDRYHVGRVMDAVHLSQNVAASLGVDVTRLSIELQLLSSAIGAVAGVLYAFALGGVFPEAFGLSFIMYALTMVVLGGTETMWGILVSGPLLWSISQFLPEEFRSLSVVINGVLLITMLLARPSGLLDRRTVKAISRLLRKAFRRELADRVDTSAGRARLTGRT